MASSARGLRLLKAMEKIAKVKPNSFDNFMLNKIKLTSISNGTIKGWFTVDANMCNLGNTLHGGHVASLIDVLSYYAQLSNIDGMTSFTTTASINYIAPVKPSDKVFVETKSLKNGKFSVIETLLHNEEGLLIAKGTNSFAAAERYHKMMKDVLDFDFREN